MNIIYHCTGCSHRTADSSSLIKGKGGCRSCGKSGYKCPKCGMMMKIRRAPGAPQVQKTTIETGVKLGSNSRGEIEGQNRSIKINRVR